MEKNIDKKCINSSICSKCGGKCCKKSGCDYFVSDFKIINKEEMIKVLDTGNVSIVSALNFIVLPNRKKIVTPFLYLRARNVDREIIDLLSLKKQCSMLTDKGCSYSIQDRPSGGVSLIPEKNGLCYMEIDHRAKLALWNDYQSLLAKLVRRYSDMSVNDRLRIDIENFIFDIMSKNFDGVDSNEIIDAKSCLSHLVESCPEEYYNARKRYLKK